MTPNCGEVPGLAVSEISTVAFDAGVSAMEEGVTWILKGAACVTVKEKVALCVIVPLVPVTLTVVVPVGVV